MQNPNLDPSDERLSTEEQQIARMRTEGKSWEQIGQVMQDTAEAVRKRLRRAIDRAASQIGILP